MAQRGNYAENNDQAVANLVGQALLLSGQNRNAAADRADEDQGREIDLVALFWHVVGEIRWVILAAILGTLVAGIYAFFFHVPVYSATSKLYILSTGESVVNLSDLQIGSSLANDYTEVFKTWEVHQMVREGLGLDPAVYSYGFMQRNLSISNPTSTRLLYITYKDTNREMAANIANAYAEAGKKFIVDVMNTKEPSKFSMALTPSSPTGRGKTTYVILGFLIGTVLALAVLVAMFLLDDRPRTPDEITKVTGLPVLAVIPKEEGAAKRRSSSSSHHGASAGKGGSK